MPPAYVRRLAQRPHDPKAHTDSIQPLPCMPEANLRQPVCRVGALLRWQHCEPGLRVQSSAMLLAMANVLSAALAVALFLSAPDSSPNSTSHNSPRADARANTLHPSLCRCWTNQYRSSPSGLAPCASVRHRADLHTPSRPDLASPFNACCCTTDSAIASVDLLILTD